MNPNYNKHSWPVRTTLSFTQGTDERCTPMFFPYSVFPYRAKIEYSEFHENNETIAQWFKFNKHTVK